MAKGDGKEMRPIDELIETLPEEDKEMLYKFINRFVHYCTRCTYLEYTNNELIDRMEEMGKDENA